MAEPDRPPGGRSTAASQKKRDPLFGAAVLKLTFLAASEDRPRAGFKEIYEGVLADLGLTDADVDAYLAEHEDEVRAAMAGGGKGR